MCCTVAGARRTSGSVHGTQNMLLSQSHPTGLMPMRVRHYSRTLEATVNSSSRHWPLSPQLAEPRRHCQERGQSGMCGGEQGEWVVLACWITTGSNVLILSLLVSSVAAHIQLPSCLLRAARSALPATSEARISVVRGFFSNNPLPQLTFPAGPESASYRRQMRLKSRPASSCATTRRAPSRRARSRLPPQCASRSRASSPSMPCPRAPRPSPSRQASASPRFGCFGRDAST